MKDIETTEDIKLLVETFYTHVMNDEILAPVFVKLNFDLESHLPIMIAFWSGILLDIHSYKGNPVKVHQQINSIAKLSSIHFERWLAIWAETTRTLFSGIITEEAISRSKSIAVVMQSKLT